MNFQLMIQIISSNRIFTVHEYSFGVVSLSQARIKDISELSSYMRTIPPHAFMLKRIYVNDKGVKDASKFA